MSTETKKINFGIREIIIIVLAALLFINNCTGPKPEVNYKKGSYDSLLIKLKNDSVLVVSLMEKSYQDNLKVVASEQKSDSLTKVNKKYIALYHKSSGVVRTQISEGVCDTTSVNKALNDCDSTIVSARNESAQKDTTIVRLKTELATEKEHSKVSDGMVDASREILKGQADDIKALEKEIIKTKRRIKIKNIFVAVGIAVENALLIFALK